MPADILGAEILQTDPETGARALKLERGPIFARVVLVDEVNRMMPKTQAALLEAMQERRVTIGRETLDLPQPFLLLATQNPIEQDGTFPLPEAQMDRFMFKVIVPQPEREERKKIAELNRLGVKARANKVVGLDDLMQATALAEKVHMSEALRDYAQDILDAAADPAASGIGGQGMVEQAMITRAAIFLEKAARINALIKGRSWVLPEDVRDVAPKILRHRILMSYSAGDLTPDKLIQEILKRVPVPSGPYGQ
jgi:MoxR-like ATPase